MERWEDGRICLELGIEELMYECVYVCMCMGYAGKVGGGN